MLRKLSQSGTTLQTIFIFLFLGLYLLTPGPGFRINTIPGNAAPLGRWITEILPANELIVKFIVAFLILLNVTILNFILRRHDLVPKQSAFTAAIASGFFLFTGPPFAMVAPMIAVLLLLFSFDSAMTIYGQDAPYAKVLNASITIGIASMIQPMAALFLVFVWMAFFTLRISNWREWAISLIGFATPYIYLIFWLFWTDRLSGTINEHVLFFNSIEIIPEKFTLRETGIMTLLGFILLISLAAFMNDTGDKIISIRKKMWIGLHFTIVALAALILSGKDAMLAIPLILIPISMLFSHLIIQTRRSWLWDVIFGVFLICVIAIRMGV